MRYLQVAVLALLILFVPASTAAAIGVAPPPVEQPKRDSPLLITSYSVAGWKLGYVQLFNSSDTVVDISGWKVRYSVSGASHEIELPMLQGLLKPGGYIIQADESIISTADFTYSLSGTMPGAVTAMRLSAPSLYHDHSVAIKGDQTATHWKRNISTSTGNYLATFSAYTPAPNYILYGSGLYEFPETIALQFTEILANPRSCSPLDTAGECHDFVKLYNPTLQKINLADFRLRVGYQGQSVTSSNTFSLAGEIGPSEYKVVSFGADNRPLSLTNSGAYIWLEDIYGVKIYNNTVVEYPDASSESKKGQAWAYDTGDGTWKWTIQPVATNTPSVFPPLPEVSAKVTSSLAPCKEGQYRSEETNRCRSIATATTALAPCDDDEERNPETNRCRKIALATKELLPCKGGQERNSETNRCRNIQAASPPDSAFKPETVADTGKAFAGWWALGGVGTLAVGYGAWEWRREVAGFVQKIGSFFTSSK